jgi:hypothetical protein
MESQHFVEHMQVPADVLHSYGDGLAESGSIFISHQCHKHHDLP